jgi:hypothetical protein
MLNPGLAVGKPITLKSSPHLDPLAGMGARAINPGKIFWQLIELHAPIIEKS